MQKQISLLEQIQKIDLGIQEIEAESNNCPLEIERFRKETEAEKDNIKCLEEVLDELAKKARSLEGEVELYKEKIKEWEAQINQVTNEKEYRAFLKEIDEAKKANIKKEEEILEIMENTEKGRKDIEEKKEELQQSILRFENVKKDIEKKKYRLDKELEKRNGSRQELVKEVRPNILEKYEKAKRRQKIVMVPAREGTCLGCYMSIPPQTFIQVQKRIGLIDCPYCQRILYWEGN